MKMEWMDKFKMVIMFISTLLLAVIAMPTQAACKGCLCPGDPCRLCPLPAMEGAVSESDEPETCARVKEIVPPISSPPGTDEYFLSLDRATMACVKNGGDVIRNSRRSDEFPSRFYCKPSIAPTKIN
ncbi:hypothetical protein SAMN05216419_10583 [Nitrosomonas cryotolerans]|uniref:Uncharacterized protein n=1 Tax=Nitrosomonas cryotolerans ATCC 49181 TaxID=1131553 RepID=A0A1N6HQ77_9PROT|nr:hypothetical protein [Nitrosomonas cryotolerans]SFQ08274.1 hypothetical protein SAMN05216419_10583 [Nitrosomonas cryotolerans]SIO21825.1 hypothetical protein SAMN02743940_1295 [Nitrosomonas cryotolerans ATCC 49181]